MLNPKLLAVIQREYLQHVRAKAFWIATFLIPAIGLAIIFINVMLQRSLVAKGKIGVVDLTGRLYEPLLAEQRARGDDEEEQEEKQAKKGEEKKARAGTAEERQKTRDSDVHVAEKFDEAKKPKIQTKLEFFKVNTTPQTLPDVRKQLNADVQKETIKAYIVLDQKTLETGAAEWRAQSVKADFVMRQTVANLLSRAATKERLKDRGVDPALYDAASVRVNLDPHEAKEIETETSKNVGFNLAVSATLFFLIYMSIFMYGAYIMRGVLEEKNNRIVEVIVSSVRPTDLMFGKILGIGLVGLTQYAVWALLAVVITLPGAAVLLGASEALPAIPVGTIAAFVVFFLLGYFLYSSIYAALAAPFNTEQEAQQFVMIPGLLLILTSTTWFFAFNSPNGALAFSLSLFPLTAPLMMFMRISVQPPPAWQIGLSIGLLLLSIWLMAWFAGRIYRVGILMYGKKPTLPEILRWARAAD